MSRKRYADMTPEERERVKAGKRAAWARRKEKTAAERAAKYREKHPDARPYRKLAPRGPSGTHATTPPIQLAEGQELKRQTVHVNAVGELIDRYDLSQTAREPARFDEVPEGHHVIKTTTRIDADGRVGMQYVTSKPEAAARERLMREAMARHASVYEGLAGVSAPPTLTDADLRVLYPLGDPHIGMLAWAPETRDHFDVKIATRELTECVRLMVAGAPSAERASIINVGDFFHAQDDSQLTPGHKHKLDVDGRIAKVIDAGYALLRGITDIALTKHAFVDWWNLPGNHDPAMAAMLASWLRAVYAHDPRVTVHDAYRAHQYEEFGVNLFGYHHGDGTPGAELPAIMANDEPQAWGRTKFRVWHTGHVHHLSRKEFPGCVVETHRTMAAGDGWHSKRYRAGRSLQAITYHRAFGEVSRNTVELARVRAALAAGKVAS